MVYGAGSSAGVEVAVDEEGVGPAEEFALEVLFVETDELEIFSVQKSEDLVEGRQPPIHVRENEFEINEADAVGIHQAGSAFEDLEIETLRVGFEDVDLFDPVLLRKAIESHHLDFVPVDYATPTELGRFEERTHGRMLVLL